MKKLMRYSGLLLLSLVLSIESASALTLFSIARNVGTTMNLAARMITGAALIAGISFIVSAFFKFHQHKQNPTQVTIGQGIVLLLVGAALCILPTLIPTFESVLTGSTNSTASIWGTGITNLVGAGN